MSRKCPLFFLLSLPLLALIAGCSGSSESRNPVTEGFRREIETAGRGLVASLAEPMARGDRAAVRKILSVEAAKSRSDAKAAERQVIVLDSKGVVYECDVPFMCDAPRDYSRTDIVGRALKGKTGSHGKIYGANDKELFLVLTPIPKEGEMTGLLGIVYDAEAVRRERGVQEKEFLAMTFSP
ncbi:MAG: hypothetical protein ACXW4K_11675 [Candidatus Deferrimicrobiaceae bacterium]